MRTVLLVSYAFPPQYDVSARRAAKLCKYLPATGWRPVVLTKDWTVAAAPEDAGTYAVTSHPDALEELAGTTVVRTPYRTRDNALRRIHHRLGGVYVAANGAPEARTRVSRWTPRALTRRALSLFSPAFGDFPDAFRGWTELAVPAGVDLATRERVDAICSLCPPATAHVVASEIARHTGLPWVPQFDDLFSFHLERQRRPEWRTYADRHHRGWLAPASLAGAVTPAMLAYVRRTYGLDGDVVMVGYDPDESPTVQRQPHDRLRLAYTGSVYPGDERPEILFDALDRVVRADASSVPPIDLVFAGTGCDDVLRAMLEPFPAAAAACRFIGRVPPADALRLQREADALVVLNCTAPTPDEGTLSFPAKTFEYLNAARPVLALPRDPGRWGDELLERTRAGVTVNTAQEAAAVLLEWLTTWRRLGVLPYSGNRAEIDRYSQPRQAAALGRLLDRAIESRRAPRRQSSARALR